MSTLIPQMSMSMIYNRMNIETDTFLIKKKKNTSLSVCHVTQACADVIPLVGGYDR